MATTITPTTALACTRNDNGEQCGRTPARRLKDYPELKIAHCAAHRAPGEEYEE